MSTHKILEDAASSQVGARLDGKTGPFLCRDCKHRMGERSWAREVDRCYASLPFSLAYLVTGEQYQEHYLRCEEMRDRDMPCGWEGKLWQEGE